MITCLQYCNQKTVTD